VDACHLHVSRVKPRVVDHLDLCDIVVSNDAQNVTTNVKYNVLVGEIL